MFCNSASCFIFVVTSSRDKLVTEDCHTQHFSESLGIHFPGYSTVAMTLHALVAAMANNSTASAIAPSVHQGIG